MSAHHAVSQRAITPACSDASASRPAAISAYVAGSGATMADGSTPRRGTKGTAVRSEASNVKFGVVGKPGKLLSGNNCLREPSANLTKQVRPRSCCLLGRAAPAAERPMPEPPPYSYRRVEQLNALQDSRSVRIVQKVAGGRTIRLVCTLPRSEEAHSRCHA